jgi:hypothetical protein
VLHAPKTPLARPLPAPPPKAKSGAKLDKHVFGRGINGNKVDWRVDHDQFEQTPGFLFRVDSTVAIVDCRVWPPKLSPAAKTYAETAIHEGNGSRITYDNRDEEPRRLRIERPGRPAIDLSSQRPKEFDIDRAIWIGDRAVFLPEDYTARGTGRRPLVWNGKKLAPAKTLPAAKPKRGTKKDPYPTFLRRGHARTGEGVDVLIWEGWGWIAKGDGFVKKWKLLPELDAWNPIVGAPAPGDGFFFHHRLAGKRADIATLREARDGVCRERIRFRQVVDGPPRTTMDGRVIFGLNRYGSAKTPVLGVFHPETDELTWVPPTVLGFRKDDQVEAYGVAPNKGEPYLWVLDDYTVRRIAWNYILSLPRRTA